MKNFDPLESVLGRVDDLDQVNLGILVSRLARERRLLNTVFNSLREGILVIDSEGTLLYANVSAISLLGFKPKDIGTTSLWKAVPDLARTIRLDATGHLAEATGISREAELTYPESRLVRIYLVPFDEDVHGQQLPRYAVILSDITLEKTRTQQQIEDERVRSLIQLSAGVAHELGNPLNSLNIHLQLMRRQVLRMEESALRSKVEHSLEICRNEIGRLDSIISHFLEAVRPRPPDFRDLDLVAVLEEGLEFLGPELEGSGVTVDVELRAAVPPVQGDRDQVKQVFFNILKNARQAMNQGGVIRVRAFVDDEYVNVQIGDTGSGISDEDLPRVFQPYFTTKEGGHGLGMMICERIMRDHGGRIGIDSRRGVGTIVTLQFPQKHRRVRLLEAEA
jgi:two-component system, sporulation sensor kinase E